MHHAFRCFGLFLLLTVIGFSISVPAMAANDQEGILVGRIAYTEGKLLRYIEHVKDWVVTARDEPFGLEDALYAGNDARAEFIMPNRTWLRIGENTQIQLIDLNPDATTVDVGSGLARLYNKSRDAVMKVTTPFGYVVAPGGAIVDLYVGDQSVEVITIRGNVDFVHDGTGARYEMGRDFFSIIADRRSAYRSNGTVDSLWDDWNGRRDTLWAQRLQDTRDWDYLPEPIRDESYTLAEHGRWERVYYENAYHRMWRPTRIDPGWRPYTVGRWSVYYGDNCWIPDEPFGYVTHHYGSWVYVESFRSWYWSPPIAHAPRAARHYRWHPGRVGWIHSGPSIGWVPLAPDEIYYGSRPWGPRTVIIREAQLGNINIIRYRYLNEAVVIHRDHFYRGKRYTPHVQRNVGRATLINNYQPAPVINIVIDKHDTDKRRFSVSDAKVTRKPHRTVVNRIDTNQQLSRSAGRINRERIEQDLRQINITSQPPPADIGLRAPLLTPKMVEAENITKPLETLPLAQKEIKPRDRERRLISDNDQRPGQRDQLPTRQMRPQTQDDIQRMRSARDARNQLMEQSGLEIPQQKTDPEQIETRRQRQLDQENQRLRSPEDTRNQQAEQEAALQQERVRQIEESQRHRELEMQQRRQEGVRRQQLEQQQRRQPEGRQGQEQEIQRQQQEGLIRQQQEEGRRRPQQEEQRRQEIQRQQQEGLIRQQQEEGRRRPQQEVQRQQEEAQRQQVEELQQRRQEGSRRQEMEAQRQQLEGQRRQEQEVQRQQQEGLIRQQQEEGRRRPQQEVQGQHEEAQRQQVEELQQRRQEGSRRQEMEAQRQQLEGQRRQEQEVQRQQQEGLIRQQQEEGRRRPQQEVQQRQQEEAQRQQVQELQQRRQEGSRRQEMEAQRQQLEGQRRQEQEVQRQQQEGLIRQQQEEGRRRPQQEVQQQEEAQRQQQEEAQRQQAQELQQRRQEGLRRQELEAQQRQQLEGQRRQELEAQRQQQEGTANSVSSRKKASDVNRKKPSASGRKRHNSSKHRNCSNADKRVSVAKR
jgi:hypothetical protein